MNSHTHANFFGNRNNRLQEDGKVFAQFGFVDIFVQLQVLTELVEGVPFFRARQTGNDVTGQTRFVFVAHSGEAFSCLSNFFFGVIRFRTWAFQDMHFECSEFDLVEAQSFGAVWQHVFEVSTGPVEHRHEVVAHGANATLRQVAQSLLIVSDPLLIVASVGFDIFVNWHAFYDRPHQACIFNDRLAFEDLFYGPYFTVRDMVQSGNHASRARLTDIS